MLRHCDFIAIFSIYGKFGAIRRVDSGRTVYKTYFSINGNLLSYTTENKIKKSLTQLLHYWFDKGIILTTNVEFLQKMLTWAKIRHRETT